MNQIELKSYKEVLKEVCVNLLEQKILNPKIEEVCSREKR